MLAIGRATAVPAAKQRTAVLVRFFYNRVRRGYLRFRAFERGISYKQFVKNFLGRFFHFLLSFEINKTY